MLYIQCRVVFLTALLSTLCYAGDGTLDPSFGGGTGIVTVPISGVLANAVKVAVQTDGKIVVVGYLNPGAVIVRYNTDGTLDATFGIVGVVSGPGDARFFNLVIQGDGKIVVVGQDVNISTIQLVRYNTDGTLDSTFGTGGIVLGQPGSLQDVALQSDNKIVAVGRDITNNLLTVRYNSDGSIDTTFDAISGSGNGSGITIQPDDKTVVAQLNSGSLSLQVIRYNVDGSLDTTFDGDGIATLAFGMIPSCVLLQSDNNIVVTGRGPGLPASNVAVRLTTTGTLDLSYGVGGIATGDTNSSAEDAVLQADGKVIIAGYDTVLNTFKMQRFDTTGNPDNSFGVSSLVTTPSGTGFGSALQQDGKIIVVGTTIGTLAFQVARYLNGPVLMPTIITFPFAGARFNRGAEVYFRGTAQAQSMVYLLIDGELVGGTGTDPVTSQWQINYVLNQLRGNYNATAVALYANGNVDIASDIVPFVIKRDCF